MVKLTCFTLVTVTALVLTACNLFSQPTVSANSAVRLTVQTQNNVSTFRQVGEIINFQYVITNTGATPLAEPVIVTDSPHQVTCPALNMVGNQDNYLDQNETVICSGKYTVTQSDITTGTIVSHAIATAGSVTSNQATFTLTLGATPQPSSTLRLAITPSSQTYGAADQTITYTFTITNVGATPLGPAQFMITDNKLGAPFNCGEANTTLAPNQSITCSVPHTITTADMGLANITSSATASGGGQTSAPAIVTVTNLLYASTTPAGVLVTPGATVQPTTASTSAAPMRITFDAGSTTVSRIGVINPNEHIQYIVTASQGQVITIKLTTPPNEVFLGVNNPHGLAIKPLDSFYTWSTEITTTGDYAINLASVTGNTSKAYTLTVTLTNTTPNPVPGVTFTPNIEAEIQKYPVSYVIDWPPSLKLGDEYTVELHMSRVSTEPELATQIVATLALATSTSQPGTLVAPGGPEIRLEGGTVVATPRMLVTMTVGDLEAFDVQVLHRSEVQEVDLDTEGLWQWSIKARRTGRQSLIFSIQQQVKTNDVENWHPLPIARRVVEVNVTFVQRLGSLDWRWITGTLMILIVISALWRWIDVLQKQSHQPERSRYRRREGSRPSTPQNALSRLPGLSTSEGSGGETIGRIFISYRRSDSADIAGRIYDRLIEEFGQAPIFKDVDSIPLGVDFKDYLDQKVGECNILLAIIGDRWVDARDETGKKRLDDHADFVRVEIESALKREIPVIPLLVRGAQMPVEEHLPYSLRRLVFKNGIQIRPDPDFHRDMDRLISALHEYI